MYKLFKDVDLITLIKTPITMGWVSDKLEDPMIIKSFYF